MEREAVSKTTIRWCLEGAVHRTSPSLSSFLLPSSWLVLHSSTARMTSSWPLVSVLLPRLGDWREGSTPTSLDRALGSGPLLFARQLRTLQKLSYHRERLLIWFPHSLTLIFCKSVKFSLNGPFFEILITNNQQGLDRSSNHCGHILVFFLFYSI